MELYKEKLKIQNRILGILGTVLGICSTCAALGEAGILPFPIPVTGDGHWHSHWRGFVTGASFGLLALMLFGMYKNAKALRSEQELKKLYVKEHDERTIQIVTYARSAAMQCFLPVGLVAIMVSGYFSITVSMTLLAAVLAASLISLLFKLYYSKKF